MGGNFIINRLTTVGNLVLALGSLATMRLFLLESLLFPFMGIVLLLNGAGIITSINDFLKKSRHFRRLIGSVSGFFGCCIFLFWNWNFRYLAAGLLLLAAVCTWRKREQNSRARTRLNINLFTGFFNLGMATINLLSITILFMLFFEPGNENLILISDLFFLTITIFAIALNLLALLKSHRANLSITGHIIGIVGSIMFSFHTICMFMSLSLIPLPGGLHISSPFITFILLMVSGLLILNQKSKITLTRVSHQKT